MSKIKWVNIEQDQAIGPFGAQEIVLKMKDGNTYNCKVEHPRGEPQNPLSQEEFETKFRDCAIYAHHEEKKISQIEDLVMNLEESEDIARLAILLGK
jgi:2-methylcitrate dehydratase PrpD